MSELIDIDARAGSFTPVRVKFRGAEYDLGRTALQLIEASSVQSQYPKADNETAVNHALRLVRPMLRAASPEIAAVIDVEGQDLTANEELAFLPVLTEVIKRIGAIRFQ